MIESVRWADSLVVVDDCSDDGSREMLDDVRQNSHGWLSVWAPWYSGQMMPVVNGRRDTTREREIRNAFVAKLFAERQPTAVVLIDGDEIMSVELRPYIERITMFDEFDDIALTCNHVFDQENYVHVYEQTYSGTMLVDPHVRVLTRARQYEVGAWGDLSDCYIPISARTFCLDGAYHFHLKYRRGGEPWESSFVRPAELRPWRYPVPEDLRAILGRCL